MRAVVPDDPWIDRLRRLGAADLGTHYARGELSTGTFELRLEQVLRAQSERDAREVLWDLLPSAARTRVDGLGTDDGDLRLESAQSRASWLLGRTPGCDARIDSVLASRRHARVSKRGSAWTVEDLGSTNGTWLNGRLVRRARLLPGDELALGSTDCVLHVRGQLPAWRAWAQRLGL